ncbi:putative retinoblastoma-like protein 1 [Apostichopus japonicus]|uniref:Putative retinoblastoma-like protein 1 n=1 Tax=Stichopus japonicus TaxID=307972 RepID=A0A2G8JBT9_STIJA|nr:putative retinoblastoma-like protein 1 [Apostichopus japonicus]
MSGTSSSFENEERGDLVAFYNSVYVKDMNDYAKKFQSGRDPLTSNQNEPPLSPLPKLRAHHTSPRKVSRKHELYVSPHKKAPSHPGVDSPTTVMRYMIQKSPSKNLNDINRMLRTKEAVHKKRALLQEDGSESPSKKSKLLNSSGGSIVVKRLQNLQQGTPEGV